MNEKISKVNQQELNSALEERGHATYADTFYFGSLWMALLFESAV